MGQDLFFNKKVSFFKTLFDCKICNITLSFFLRHLKNVIHFSCNKVNITFLNLSHFFLAFSLVEKTVSSIKFVSIFPIKALTISSSAALSILLE